MVVRERRRNCASCRTGLLWAGVLLCSNATVRGQAPESRETVPESQAAESVEAELADGLWERSAGYLRTRYKLRFTDDDQDHDLFQYGSATVGDPYRDRVTLSFFGRLAADLDGSPGGPDANVFSDIRDTYDKDLTGKLYHAWMDIHRLGPVERLRLGRQNTYDTPEFAYFDGASVVTRKWTDFFGLRGFAYAGVPVHPYESSPDGDVIAGTALESSPWRGGKLRLDWIYVRDDHVQGLQQDHLLAGTIRQVLFDTTNLYARWTGFADANRDVTARVHQLFPDWDLDVTVSYRELFQTQRAHAIDFDPYYSAMREYRPYRQGELRATKLVGEHFGVDAGFMVRELAKDDHESAYNHEFLRYFVYPSIRDWPVEKMEITLFADLWDSQDDEIYSVGGEVSFEASKSLRVTVGSLFELYRYNFFNDREREHVRIYYAGLKGRVTDNLELRARYEYEDSEFDAFHTFMLDLMLSFGGKR